MRKLKIAMLHLLPKVGEIKYNQTLIENAVKQAGVKDVDLIVTPELAISGLKFSRKFGTDWIRHQPDEWMSSFFSLVKSLQTNVLLGCPEKADDGNLYNSVFVINREGELIARHRKFTSFIDDWSTSGKVNEPIVLGDVTVGILICADAYDKKFADTLYKKGAEILIAPSAWAPGMCGPNGEWEQRSIDTGLPLFVCNRTGEDDKLEFWESESSVIKNGKRLFSHKSNQSVIIFFEWDMQTMDLVSGFNIENLNF